MIEAVILFTNEEEGQATQTLVSGVEHRDWISIVYWIYFGELF